MQLLLHFLDVFLIPDSAFTQLLVFRIGFLGRLLSLNLAHVVPDLLGNPQFDCFILLLLDLGLLLVLGLGLDLALGLGLDLAPACGLGFGLAFGLGLDLALLVLISVSVSVLISV